MKQDKFLNELNQLYKTSGLTYNILDNNEPDEIIALAAEAFLAFDRSTVITDKKIKQAVSFLKKKYLSNNCKIVLVLDTNKDQDSLGTPVAVQIYTDNWLDNYRYLIAVTVVPEYEGRGIAKEILEFLKEDAEKKSIKGIVLDVESYKEKAINLYKKLGYSILTQKEINDMPRLPDGSRIAVYKSDPPSRYVMLLEF